MRLLAPHLERIQIPLSIPKRIVQSAVAIYAAAPLFSVWAFGLIPKCKDIPLRKYKNLGNAWGDF